MVEYWFNFDIQKTINSSCFISYLSIVLCRISTYQSESESHLGLQPAPATRTDCAGLCWPRCRVFAHQSQPPALNQAAGAGDTEIMRRWGMGRYMEVVDKRGCKSPGDVTVLCSCVLFRGSAVWWLVLVWRCEHQMESLMRSRDQGTCPGAGLQPRPPPHSHTAAAGDTATSGIMGDH